MVRAAKMTGAVDDTVIKKGTKVYHRTFYDFKGNENRSFYFTEVPPRYEPTFRGATVHEYATLQDIKVLSEKIEGNMLVCLKIWLMRLLSGSSCETVDDKLQNQKHVMNCVIVAGYSGLKTYADNNRDNIELIIYHDPGSRPSILDFKRSYELQCTSEVA